MCLYATPFQASSPEYQKEVTSIQFLFPLSKYRVARRLRGGFAGGFARADCLAPQPFERAGRELRSRGLHGHAAVHDQHLTGDVARSGTGQKQGSRRNVLHLSK